MKSIFVKERKIIYQNVSDIFRLYQKQFMKLGILQALFLAGNIAGPFLYGILIDDVMIKKNIRMLFFICTGYAAIYIFDTALTVSQRKIQVHTYNAMKLNIRNTLWDKYLKAPYHFHEKYGNGDLKQRIDTDAASLETYINEQVIGYYYNVVTAMIYFAIIVVISWKLAVFSMLMIPVSFWMTKRMAEGSGKAWGAYREDYGEYESWLQASLANWKEVKALSAEEKQLKVFEAFWGKLKVNFYKGCLYYFINRSFIGFSDFFITKMNLYFIGGLLIFSGNLRIGMLFVFMKYYEKFFAGIGEITNANICLQEYKPSLNRVIEIYQMKFDDKGNEKTELTGDIKYENVSFQYNPGQKHVLNNINTTIRGKECLAIAGKSGNGKTTFIKLLLGMYHDYEGRITINGIDIKEIEEEYLHSKVAAIMQDSILFNMTIKENMKLAKPDASDEEIVEVCKRAYIDDDISRMPQQYDTVIGENGIKLSGGQRQRLAIARALLKKAQIIIFDEATAALDSESEKKIHDTINALKKTCTIILIAHRMSSILLSERIIIIENTKIAKEGRYEELMGKSEEFDRLFKGQYEVSNTL